MVKRFGLLIIFILMVIVYTGCAIIGKADSPISTNAISTAAMKTVQVVMTENAFSTKYWLFFY